ncbi:MAG: HAD-IIB family hydrolase [Thermodesulfobacteriota bacterium]|nr:HAD-IIB family hydrolase [Thermodesulfobacteriota bacterium]
MIKKKGFKYVVFSDLDGTLLDHYTYSFVKAEVALKKLKEASIPLVLCSSKTRAEIDIWQTRLSINDPIISENGGAIFLKNLKVDRYKVIELGMPYKEIVLNYKRLKQLLGDKIRGFSEMTEKELMEYTGLSFDEVVLAKKRDYSEPFLFTGDSKYLGLLKDYVRELGLNLNKGGRFFHLTGDNDKGKAVKILIDFYKKIRPEILTVGIGDSQNDFPMLKMVDIPILVMKHNNAYEEIGLLNIRLAGGIGPAGWNKAIMSLF